MNPKYVKPATCAGCDLALRGNGYVPGDGPLSSRLVFIAEAAGPEEVIVGQPLVGAAGGTHTRLLHRAGIDRGLTRADNTIRCMPPGMWFDDKAPWFYPAMNSCSQYRTPSLAAVPDDAVVVTLGGVALRTVLNLHGVEGVRVEHFHHTVNRDPTNRFWVVPSFHPSHLQRGAMNLLEVVTSAYRLAHRVSTGGFVRTPATLVVDPSPEVIRTFVRDHLRRVREDPEGVHLSLDTEFAEKIGNDENDVLGDSASPLTRINIGNDKTTGYTFPYAGPYIALTEELLNGLAWYKGIVWLWNKYADWDKLYQAGHTLDGIVAYDGMWAWHYLQSDLPMSLGFVAPMASDFGPWKHWGKDKSKEGPYAAADAVQNWRTCIWIMKALIQSGQWHVFEQDWHQRDEYVLRPSKEMGVPADRPALEQFHQELQVKQAAILASIKQVGAEGQLKPKNGYAKKPKSDQPPQSVLGISKSKKKSEAKAEYTAAGVVLVERTIGVAVRVCRTCGKESVGPKHRCPLPKRSKKADAAAAPADPPRVADVVSVPQYVARWFWQVPFNPSSWQQILGYIEGHGHQPGVHRKTKKATTDASSLKKLAAETGDPLYQLLLDGRAVEKVDSTYAVGTLARLDADDRIHPEVTPRPSTLRDSSIGPDLQNVVADKDSGRTLAAGFRKCIKARDGIPPDITTEEVVAWEQRWQS
jgi:uracil-DNA glycosylase family 4